MNDTKLDIVIIGLTITSTWGNGHATTYRGLVKELSRLGHRVTFLECDRPWYASNREFTSLSHGTVHLYSEVEDLRSSYTARIREADVVIVGSYVPNGIAVGNWVLSTAQGVRAFYDIDTPVTLAALKGGTCQYLAPHQIPEYDLYLSFTGGPTLQSLERDLHSPCARPLYCSVDAELYYPESTERKYDIGYLGTYAADRQRQMDELLLRTARAHPSRSFAVAGPQYPAEIVWPSNVVRLEHLPASAHREFYSSQQFTLNLTRRDMARSGYSPSVRLFEAAACGTPILSDCWPGLDHFFKPDREIIAIQTARDVDKALNMPHAQRMQIALQARKKTLKFHTAAFRAKELVAHIASASRQHTRPVHNRSRVLLPGREATAAL